MPALLQKALIGADGWFLLRPLFVRVTRQYNIRRESERPRAHPLMRTSSIAKKQALFNCGWRSVPKTISLEIGIHVKKIPTGNIFGHHAYVRFVKDDSNQGAFNLRRCR